MIEWHARQRQCCSLYDVQYLIQKLPCPLPPRGEEARAFLLTGWGTARVCLAITIPCNTGMSCQSMASIKRNNGCDLDSAVVLINTWQLVLDAHASS